MQNLKLCPSSSVNVKHFRAKLRIILSVSAFCYWLYGHLLLMICCFENNCMDEIFCAKSAVFAFNIIARANFAHLFNAFTFVTLLDQSILHLRCACVLKAISKVKLKFFFSRNDWVLSNKWHALFIYIFITSDLMNSMKKKTI